MLRETSWALSVRFQSFSHSLVLSKRDDFCDAVDIWPAMLQTYSFQFKHDLNDAFIAVKAGLDFSLMDFQIQTGFVLAMKLKDLTTCLEYIVPYNKEASITSDFVVETKNIGNKIDQTIPCYG